MIQFISFYLISAVLIFSAVMVVTQRNLFTCALYLASALAMVAGFFVLIGADFLAAVQILLYVGGVVVILAFAVMLSSIEQAKIFPQVNEQWFPALCVSALLVGGILWVLKGVAFSPAPITHQPTTHSIGRLLLREMALPFEAVSLILLAALVGAVLFSKKEKPETADDQSGSKHERG